MAAVRKRVHPPGQEVIHQQTKVHLLHQVSIEVAHQAGAVAPFQEVVLPVHEVVEVPAADPAVEVQHAADADNIWKHPHFINSNSMLPVIFREAWNF